MAAKSVKIPSPIRLDTSILYRLVEYSPGCYAIDAVPGAWEARRAPLPDFKRPDQWPTCPMTVEQVYVPRR
jgi:hypothetical protein